MHDRLSFSELRLILGDQLNELHSWFDRPQKDILYVMMEIRPESEYVVHHIQKITGFFMAMRRFSEELKTQGFNVRYYRISDPDNRQSFHGNLEVLAKKYRIPSGAFQEPDEYRLDRLLEEVFGALFKSWQKVGTEHFYTGRAELAGMFKGKKSYLMESFYRRMRRKHGVLLDGSDKPEGGKWNYDKENRSRLPAGHNPPGPLKLTKDAGDVLQEIIEAKLPHIGRIDPGKFNWPASRKEALAVLGYFLENLLPSFGTYQDAMAERSWSLYHSLLSFALNLKMIAPREVVKAVENHWRENPEKITLAQAEGFIRQVLGWREYMRGVYWAEMPAYEKLNYFGHTGKLPAYYWTGRTRMNCMKHTIGQSLKKAYAHHIQRLMVTGNFALLAGLNPDEVDSWYLGIYIDAIQWVEITNARGMSQFADGGIVGTKPYVSSANYIDRMSDYCRGCTYNKKLKTGHNACPFNSLYWHFYHRNRQKLERIPRIGLVYRTWDKVPENNRRDILAQAEQYLEQIESL